MSNNSISFKARVPMELRWRLYEIAKERGELATSKLENKITKVESWGHSDFYLQRETFHLLGLGSGMQEGAGLRLVKPKEGFGQTRSMFLAFFKNNVYDTFMSLRKKDIINAEKELNW